jgi:hypothetical protein
MLGAMKLYLIGVHNLIVKVDTRYIKGMLANPNLYPRASINRWILVILTFHFILIHVPRTHHGPDDMSRHYPQPGDESDPPDDIDDWVDELFRFMHMINTDFPQRQPQLSIGIFVSEVADINLPSDTGVVMSYSNVPWTVKAQLDNDCLVLV